MASRIIDPVGASESFTMKQANQRAMTSCSSTNVARPGICRRPGLPGRIEFSRGRDLRTVAAVSRVNCIRQKSKAARQEPDHRAAKSLFHQQHLPCAFDGKVEAALVMRRQAGVFPRKDSA